MEPNNTQPDLCERIGQSLEPPEQRLADAHWGTLHQVAFRFACSYLFLYVFPFPFSLSWGGRTGEIHETMWHKIVPWVAIHVLRLRFAITIYPEVSGGSDTRYDYVKVFCIALVAAVATVVWSMIDRNRLSYSRLNQWIRLYVRLVLAAAMLSYGGGKVIPQQMPPPSLSTLIQPVGDLTPYRLLWAFMGASPGYEIFCGAVEMLGGVLLLIPATTMLGALLSLAAITNVFLLNTFYDVNVKLWALHLLLFAWFLLLPDVRRLVNLFVLNRGNEPKPMRPLFQRRWLNCSAWGVQVALGIYFIVTTFAAVIPSFHRIESLPVTNPLYGIWIVDEFTADGTVRPPLLSDDLRWQRMIFTSPSGLTIQDMKGQFFPYAVTMDKSKNTLLIASVEVAGTSTPWWNEWISGPIYDAYWRSRGYTELNYSKPQPDAMVLEGRMNGHQFHVTLKKEQRQFVLQERRHRWINDECDFYQRTPTSACAP
jgi:hypothetical protein